MLLPIQGPDLANRRTNSSPSELRKNGAGTCPRNRIAHVSSKIKASDKNCPFFRKKYSTEELFLLLGRTCSHFADTQKSHSQDTQIHPADTSIHFNQQGKVWIQHHSRHNRHQSASCSDGAQVDRPEAHATRKDGRARQLQRPLHSLHGGKSRVPAL